jgi:hypothetical protein
MVRAEPEREPFHLDVWGPARDGVVRIRLSSGPRDSGATMAALFPELDLVDIEEFAEGWRHFARRSAPSRSVMAARGEWLALDESLPWQIVVSHYLLDQMMRMQAEWGFFHAGTVAMGEQGVFLGGVKGAGKSTLALALAARGHGFLGDEIGAIHCPTRAIAPFPRAVSIRRGPQAARVHDYLESRVIETERLADGTERARLLASHAFPDSAPRPVCLTHAFFLGTRSSAPRAEPFDFSAGHLSLLGPLRGALGSAPDARSVVAYLKVFAGVHCYRLSPGGSPDETVDLVEAIVEGE